MKTDQEPSVHFLRKDLIEDRQEGKTVLEESPVRSSGSNGVVEKGAQEVEGGVRSIFSVRKKDWGARWMHVRGL